MMLYELFIIFALIGVVLAIVFGYPAAMKYLSQSQDLSPNSKYIFAQSDSCKIDYIRDPKQIALPLFEQKELFCVPVLKNSKGVILTATNRAALQKLYAESEFKNHYLYLFQTAKPLTMEQLNNLIAQFRASTTDESLPGSHYLGLRIDYDGQGKAALIFYECKDGLKEQKGNVPGWLLGASGSFYVPAKMIEGDTCFGQCL